MAATTPTEANKALVRRAIEKIVDERDFDGLEETHANDFVLRGAMGVEEEVSGRDAYKALLRETFEAFPDLSVTLEEIVAEDELVAYRLAYTGTHEGEFMGVPATGETANWDGMALVRVEDGKITELRGYANTLELMRQLGITEVPGE